MTNKRWIVPLIILIILLGAYGFRWEQGETITKNNTKTVFYKDRWLAQQWHKYYAANNYYELPFISDYAVNIKAQDIINHDTALLAQLKDIDDQKAQLNAEAEPLYAKKTEQMQSEQKYLAEWVALHPNADLYTEFTEGRKYAKERTPQADTQVFQQAEYSYSLIADQMNNLNYKRESIYGSAQSTAKIQLTDQAIRYRKITTVAWWGLTVLVGIWLLSYFWRYRKVN